MSYLMPRVASSSDFLDLKKRKGKGSAEMMHAPPKINRPARGPAPRYPHGKMTRKSERGKQSIKSAVNPFAVKKAPKRSSKKIRPSKKHNLEAVDHQFASLHRGSLDLKQDSGKKRSCGNKASILGSSSSCINDIIKRTKNTDISKLPATPSEL